VLRVTLVGKKSGREISACALLDSGAEGIIINEDFARRNKLTLRTLVNPLPVKNVDGTLNKRGSVRYTTIQRIRIKTLEEEFHEETTELYVTTLGDHDIILGTDWLHAHNPEVNWVVPQIALTRCPKTCSLSQQPQVVTSKKEQTRATTINVIQAEDELFQDQDTTFRQEAMESFLYIHSFAKYDDLAIRAKTTTSTTLAAKATPRLQNELLPVQFQRYSKVFSETASHRLPAHQSWDHTIELKPGSSMRNCGIYRLTPKESEALKEYITEYLRRGYIWPSKSPMASPFFFMDKKDGKLRPVQDYRALNNITIKNAAPLPLIPELIDKLLGAIYFTKLDIHWGYNNIQIKLGDEYKAAFKTPLGLFEPTVMTFGLCNAPATFQTFMNKIFEDLIDEGHVVVYLDDILIFSDNLDQLDQLTHEVLSRLEKYDLYLKPEKCVFAQTSIEYLGIIIANGQVRMDPAKLAGITSWPTPRTVKQVQAFLGFCNFYRRFIQGFSQIARSLFELTKKGAPFHWERSQESAF
jgi:hypothetical protein